MTFPTGLILDVNPDSFGLSDGASVPQLTNSAGTHIHGTQAVTANRGIYRTNVQNGKGAVEFDGVNDSYSFANLFNFVSEGEVFLVYSVSDDPAVTPYVSGLWTTAAGGGFPSTHFPFNDGSIYDGWGSTTRFSVGNPTPSLTIPRLYNVSSATGDWKARLDSALLFSSASNTTAFPNPFLFGRSNDTSYYAKGKLFRLLIFNRVLQEYERQAVQDTLGAEYLLDYYVPLLLPETGLELYCEANRMTLSDGGQVSGLTDYSGKGRHLTASTNYPTFETNEINSKPVIRFHGTSNPLKNTAQFSIRCGWILAKYSGGSMFPDYKGLLSDLNVTTILLGKYDTANFLDNQSTQIFEFRSNDRLYPESDAPAPMQVFKLIFFRFWRNLSLDGVQLGQQTNFTSTKWHGDVPFLALYSRDFCESDIRKYSKAVADAYSLTLADVYPYQADKGSPKTSIQSVNFYDPPGGNRISEVLDTPKRELDLKFSSRRQAEVKAMKAFHNSHYAAAVPCIYRDYDIIPPEDIEGYIDSPYQASGAVNDWAYAFKFKDK